MGYMDLLKDDACTTDIQAYLIDGETVAVTIRIPKNLRDSAKAAAAYKGTNFSAFVRECLIDELTNRYR